MINSVRYQNAEQTEIAFDRDGVLMSAPYPGSRYDAEIAAWVALGNTITPYTAPYVPEYKLEMICCDLQHTGAQAGFFGTLPTLKPSVTGATDSAKLASLITALVQLGLVKDETT